MKKNITLYSLSFWLLLLLTNNFSADDIVKQESAKLTASDLTITWVDGFDANLSKYNTTYRSVFGSGLVPVLKAGKYGYINKTGQEVIACQYDKAQNFSEGLAAVKKADKWSYINTDGKAIGNFIYEHAGEFKQGLAAVVKTGKLGYIDKNGVEVIACQYDYSEETIVNNNYEIAAEHNFNDGFALNIKAGKWGMLDRKGNFKILDYERIMPYSEGLASVRKNQNWGAIDIYGREVIACQYYRNFRFKEGIASVDVYDYKNGKAVGTHCVAIDKQGKTLFTPVVPFTNFSEDLAATLDITTLTFSYIDKTGKVVIVGDYDIADDFHEGAALVYKTVGKNRYAGFINKEGEIILPLEYEINGYFNEGAVLIKKDGKLGILTIK